MKKHFLGNSAKIQSSVCPNCGCRLNAAAPFDDEGTPRPGDASICIECGHLCIFTKDMSLRHPTSEEIIKLAGHKGLVAASSALAQLHAVKKQAK